MHGTSDFCCESEMHKLELHTYLSRMGLLKIEYDMDKLSNVSSSSDIVRSGCSSNSQDCLHLLCTFKHLLCTFKPMWVHECFRIITVFRV